MVLNWLGGHNQFDAKKQVHEVAAVARERHWDVGARGCLHLGKSITNPFANETIFDSMPLCEL